MADTTERKYSTELNVKEDMNNEFQVSNDKITDLEENQDSIELKIEIDTNSTETSVKEDWDPLKPVEVTENVSLLNDRIKNEPNTLKTEQNPKIQETTRRCSVCNDFIPSDQFISLNSSDDIQKCSVCISLSNLAPEINVLPFGINSEKIKKPTYVCLLCNKSFTTKASQMRHIFGHTGERPFICTTCGKSFAKKSILNSHILIHTGERKYRCTVCARKFTQKSHLNNHILIHTDERRFPCTVCPKKFIQKYDLIKHTRVHTGDKPFTCEACNTNFRQKANLNQHINMFCGKKFWCDICNKRYPKKAIYTKHMLEHTGPKLFPCDICNKNFNRKSNLKRHRLGHIKIKIEKEK